MLASYNDALVLLSVLIAAVASFTALDLAKRREAATGWLRDAWLATAALAMGGGIWAMHFVGMLAFEMPGMAVSYDLPLTLLSAFLPVLVTGLSFLAVGRAGRSVYALAVGGVFMGLGIASMHYIGMEAMNMPAELNYEKPWVALSLLIGIGASTLAIWLAGKSTRLQWRLVAAGVLGIAISGMHYAAMEGAVFTHSADAATEHGLSLNPVTLALGVTATTLVLLLLALIAAINDSRTAVLRAQETEALLMSQEQLRTLYSCTPLPLHALDREGRIQHVSDAWLDLLGYSREEVAGRKLFDFMSEASSQRASGADWARLSATGRLADAEYHLLTKTGQRLEVRAFGRVERDTRGHFLRVLGGLIDDTKTRQVEAALRQSQKVEALGRLTSGVSHDFNNILAVILGNLELLRRNGESTSIQERLITNAIEASQRGGTLTRRLLSFARQQPLQPEPVSLEALVNGMSPLLMQSVGSNVDIETDFPPDIGNAYVDANQLEMVLLNLAINANDAMPDGGILRIEVSHPPAVPEALAGREQRYLCLAVTDSGHGMDAETLSRATDPFFTTKVFGKGTGLGLAMAHGVAEQSGGQLVIYSQPGQGTRVELWLPMSGPSAAVGDAAGLEPRSRMSSCNAMRDSANGRRTAT
jgi:PAS domain S-box-containing protein